MFIILHYNLVNAKEADFSNRPIYKDFTRSLATPTESDMAEGRFNIGSGRLQEKLYRFPSDLLDRPCFECHLAKLVRCIDSETMELIAIDLELTTVEVDDIKTAWPRKPAQQRMEMFKTWREKNKSQATYRYTNLACRLVILDNV